MVLVLSHPSSLSIPIFFAIPFLAYKLLDLLLSSSYLRIPPFFYYRLALSPQYISVFADRTIDRAAQFMSIRLTRSLGYIIF